MTHIDVFNGDADGICALHQLRLHTPAPGAQLITGVKRDIQLLSRVGTTSNAMVTVLDISLDKNRSDLERLLHNNNRVVYIDHHYSGNIPDSPLLETHIDPSPKTCTSLLVSGLLVDAYNDWAIAGAFGDNLDEAARTKARQYEYSVETTAHLQEIGILLNYNGYGSSLEDLFFPPAELFQEVHSYREALDFFFSSQKLTVLRQGYTSDMEQAAGMTPILQTSSGRVFQLPGTAWARRVVGVYSNKLAREQPDMAHAILIDNADGSQRISVRAPLSNRTGADTLCRQFPSGGGREGAAGINQLPGDLTEAFLAAFSAHFTK